MVGFLPNGISKGIGSSDSPGVLSSRIVSFHKAAVFLRDFFPESDSLTGR